MLAATILILWVPGHKGDKEPKKGALALAERLVAGNKAKDIRLVQVRLGDNAAPELGTTQQFHCAGSGAEGTGAYVIAHHGVTVTGFGHVSPDDMAAFMAKYLVDQKLPPLRKVALLACGAASAEGPMSFETDNRALLHRFCQALAGKALYPLVAGWDEFISVCFAKNPAYKFATLSAEVASGEHRGRKFVMRPDPQGAATPSPFGPQTAELARGHRAAHKKAVKWQGNSWVDVDLQAGWTQKLA